jgi:hydroxymethylbilane synthase
MPRTIRIGTRSSKLALWQAYNVADALHTGGYATEIVHIETKGDKVLDVSLSKIGSKGVFTEEIEAMLEQGHIDIAVHSAKDMPSSLPEGFELIAFGAREEALDVLLSHKEDISLEKPGLVLGTSSTRRLAQLARYYPGHRTVTVRGNLQTRIRKMEEGTCDALLLAFAGVKRMGYEHLIRQRIAPEMFTPPAGQGSVAIEAHSRLPENVKQDIRNLFNHPKVEACILAERAFLKNLGGGCSVPVFALATEVDQETIHINGGVLSLDGMTLIRAEAHGSADIPSDIGKRAADEVIALGGLELLKKIKQEL